MPTIAWLHLRWWQWKWWRWLLWRSESIFKCEAVVMNIIILWLFKQIDFLNISVIAISNYNHVNNWKLKTFKIKVSENDFHFKSKSCQRLHDYRWWNFILLWLLNHIDFLKIFQWLPFLIIIMSTIENWKCENDFHF